MRAESQGGSGGTPAPGHTLEKAGREGVDPLTILIVEDDRSVRDQVSLVLAEEGYRVLQADCGEAALSILQKRAPDLIISDIMMPGMDGFHLLETVRANDAWYPIPFIFLTAKAGRSDIRYGMGLGADDYLPKPFELSELLSAVEARLARAAATRAAVRRDAASQMAISGIAGEDEASAQALVARGDLLRLEGRYAEAMAHCSRALDLVSGTAERDRFVRALAHRNAGLCQVRLGEEEAGRQTLETALHLYEDLGSPYDVGTVHSDLGLACEVGGDLEGAVSHYEAALRCWEALGSLGPWADTLQALGAALCTLGRYDEALPVLHESAAKAQQAGNVWVEAHARGRLGDLHRDLGALGQSRGQYVQALEIARRGQVGFVVTHALIGIGEILRLQGNLPEARTRLLEALEHATEREATWEIGMCHTSLGIVASDGGDLAAAAHHLDQAIEFLAAESHLEELSRAYLYRAQVAYLAGQRDPACAGVESALTLSAQLSSDRFLLVDGQQLKPLLQYCAAEGIATDELGDLLERIGAHRAQAAGWVEQLGPDEHLPTLKVYALGHPRVEMDGEAVHWRTAQPRELFFYLLHHPRGLRRDQIGAVFWPDLAPDSVSDNFHVTIYYLRQAISRDIVIYEDGLYRANLPGGSWYDVHEFESLLDRSRELGEGSRAIALLEQALRLYQGDYLGTAAGVWASLERERLQQRYLAALGRLAELYTQQGDLPQAIAVYQALLTQDPYLEDVHRRLMRSYQRRGDRASAIRQYLACARILREELGLSPAPETEALYLEIVA